MYEYIETPSMIDAQKQPREFARAASFYEILSSKTFWVAHIPQLCYVENSSILGFGFGGRMLVSIFVRG